MLNLVPSMVCNTFGNTIHWSVTCKKVFFFRCLNLFLFRHKELKFEPLLLLYGFIALVCCQQHLLQDAAWNDSYFTDVKPMWLKQSTVCLGHRALDSLWVSLPCLKRRGFLCVRPAPRYLSLLNSCLTDFFQGGLFEIVQTTIVPGAEEECNCSSNHVDLTGFCLQGARPSAKRWSLGHQK